MIRKARIESSFTIEALATETALKVERLQAYELGEIAIPIPELEAIARAMHTSIFEYQDRHSPLGSWFTEQKATEAFKELPAELQGFVCKPLNRPYLELAARLSEMSVDKLRAVAEGLLEITL